MPVKEKATEPANALEVELAQTRALLVEREAELDRVRRGQFRFAAERTRVEELQTRLEARDGEITQVREQMQRTLQVAEEQLAAAARKIDELTQPKLTSAVAARELDDARVRAARLQAELGELRAERDELKRQLEAVRGEVEGARGSAAALQAAIAVRDARAGSAESAARSALERAETAEGVARFAISEQDRLAKAEEEARALAAGAQARLAELRVGLEMAQRELAGAQEERRALTDQVTGLRADLHTRVNEMGSVRNQVQVSHEAEARLRAELEAERARESQMIAEVREREAKMVQEVQLREAQLVQAAQARDAQLQQDLKDANEQIAALTGIQSEGRGRDAQVSQALGEAREREAALDAELRLVRGQQAEAQEQLQEQLETMRVELRKAKAELEEITEKEGRAEARAAELQSVIDSLGRERATLRSEAGAMRARVEMLSAADERARRMAQELDDLRGENEFLNQELARANASSPHIGSPAPKQ